MTPTPTNIKSFFEGSKQYAIPVYQRAYSWEEKQWNEFLEDLKEATKGENHYFFGNVLLEKPNDEVSDIIDGQQRITTIIIFVRALCNELKNRTNAETFKSDVTNDEFIEYIQQDYLINRSKPKLEAVKYDGNYFRDFIIKGDENKHKPQTPSQERIRKAKEFFEKKLKNSTEFHTEKLLAIFEAMEKAELIRIEFKKKKDSVLMFELQNNRGKDLTNMEKLKSYLAYQIYTYCGDEAENKLSEITEDFKEIYCVINDIKEKDEKKDEDKILGYFNKSFSRFGFNYEESDNTKNYKKELKEQEYKIAWIENYVKELKNAFFDFKDFEKSTIPYAENLRLLDVSEVYPFILKTYRLFREDEKSLEIIFKSLEIMAFRHKLVKTRAVLATRLNEILKFESIESLINGLKELCSGEDGEWWKYWRDKAVQNALVRIYIESKDILPYLFMRYEKALREKDAKMRGYEFDNIKSSQIEHIAPQTETIKESGKEKAIGYGEYDDDFKESYMNCIGNLLLIAGSHNGSIGNKPFSEKLASYKNSPLVQQREIERFLGKECIWDKEAIDKRHEELEKFVLETWSFK